MPDPSSSAAAGRRMAEPPVSGVRGGEGLPEKAEGLPSPPPPARNTVVPWPIAIGVRISIARSVAVARKPALFIRSSLSRHVSPATSTWKHAIPRRPTHLSGRLIHRSAWKTHSPKSGCRILHTSALQRERTVRQRIRYGAGGRHVVVLVRYA